MSNTITSEGIVSLACSDAQAHGMGFCLTKATRPQREGIGDSLLNCTAVLTCCAQTSGSESHSDQRTPVSFPSRRPVSTPTARFLRLRPNANLTLCGEMAAECQPESLFKNAWT